MAGVPKILQKLTYSVSRMMFIATLFNSKREHWFCAETLIIRDPLSFECYPSDKQFGDAEASIEDEIIARWSDFKEVSI